ncbi:MAG: ubiquitin-like small modifier protein 1 [Acidimicrobiia bacterium]
MAVDVKFPTVLRPHVGGAASVRAEGTSVREVFDGLISTNPGLDGQLVGDDGGVHKFVNVYRDDEDIRYLDGLDTPVSDGDVISILPAVAGGCGVVTAVAPD